MKSAIIVDLDGTLCNVDHRVPLVREKKWDEFHSSLTKDSLNHWCFEIVQKFQENHEIILVTGRPEDYRQATEDWLKTYKVPYCELYMRAKNDYRSDEIVKSEIYENHLKSRFKILFVIEDRKRVVDMWRTDYNLVVLQCADGNF